MMLLRTLVLERSDDDAPLNGALLCSYAVPQIASNFLVYSLDEETEPGSARVYVAALRKKLDRYFLSGVDSPDELHVAMQVFKQILTLAASGAKSISVTDTQIPYHFIDLKGCKLPPARPEDHHSVTIKKALVMKVVSLGAFAPVSAAIESATLIVPSIRFSSQMVSSSKAASPPEGAQPPLLEELAEPQPQPQAQAQAQPQTQLQQFPLYSEPEEPASLELPVYEPPTPRASAEHNSLFEVGSTLNSLARVAHELAQQKTAVLQQEASLEQQQDQLQQARGELERERQEQANRTLEKEASLQLRAQTLENREAQLADALVVQQNEQIRMDEYAANLEKRAVQACNQESVIRQKSGTLAAALTQLSGLRQDMYARLLELDQTLDGLCKHDD